MYTFYEVLGNAETENNKGVLITILVIIGLGIGGFSLWAQDSHTAMPEANNSLESDEAIQVKVEPWITFKPLEKTDE